MGRRAGSRCFKKTVHHYEPWIDNKRHKVAIKMEVSGTGKVEYFTDHFKDDNQRPIVKTVKVITELYNWIDEQLATLPDVVWEKKILIQVNGQSRGDLEGGQNYQGEDLLKAEIDVSATALEIGTASDGQIWSRPAHDHKSLRKFDKTIGYGLEQKRSYYYSKQGDDPGDPYSRALIDDTPENRELLVAFAVKFDGLRDQFFRAFAPEHVHRFLNHAAGTLLLNGIDGE